MELEEEKHQHDEENGPAEDDGGREVVRGAGGSDGGAFVGFLLATDVFEAFGEGCENGRRCAREGDHSCGSHCTRTHGADVDAPEIGGAHVCG